MNLRKYLHPQRIIQLKSRSKNGAFKELIDTFIKTAPDLNKNWVTNEFEIQEKELVSILDEVVAVPHIHISMNEKLLIGIGISDKGIDYLGNGTTYIKLILMIIGHKEEQGLYLTSLASLSRLLSTEGFPERILAAATPQKLMRLFSEGKSQKSHNTKIKEADKKITEQVISTTKRLTKELDIHSVFIDFDELRDDVVLSILKKVSIIPVFKKNTKRLNVIDKKYPDRLLIPEYDLTSSGHIKLALFQAYSRKLIKKNELIIFLHSNGSARGITTLELIRLTDKYTKLTRFNAEQFEKFTNPHVVEKIIQIAFDIAVAGSENRKVGTLFVVGDSQNVLPLTQQLVLNPFRRHGEVEEKWNILDPSLDNMIKELAQLDGAFIIDGDGTILSAASYIGMKGKLSPIPKGLGTRHQAAANITTATGAIALAVSETNGNISLFQEGKIVMEIKKIERNIDIRFTI